MEIRWRSGPRWIACLASVLVLASGPHVNATGPDAQGQDSTADGQRGDGERGSRGASRRAKLSRWLTRKSGTSGSGSELVDVIVAFNTRPADGERALAAQLGGLDRRGYKRFPFRAMRIPQRMLNKLADNPRVKFVAADQATMGAGAAPVLEAARVPGSSTILNTANAAFKGGSVTVAVVDSGVFEHGDYYYTLRAQHDFVNGAGGVLTSFSDPFGHGTHIAGMVGADGYYSSGSKYRGASTRAGVVSLRVLDAQGRGKVSDLIAALDWIVDEGIQTYGIRVANLSLGTGVYQEQELDPLVQAVDAVWDAGVVVVVSAGNCGASGHYTITSPGNSRKVITVGSLTDNGSGANFNDDRVSSFSSRGPTLYDHILKPDLLAPGDRVVSTLAEGSTLGSLLSNRILCGYSGNSCNWRYLRLSGTSMATAVVSGAVARMLEKNPSLSPSTVKARLMRSARKIQGDATTTGAGVLDVESAMNATGSLQKPALSPLLGLSSDGSRVYVENTSVLWGSGWSASSIWTSGSLWSNGFLWTNGYLWSDAALWSNGYLWSNGSLWPNGSLWTNGALWSDAYLWSEYANPSSADVEDPNGSVDDGSNTASVQGQSR